VNVVPVPGGRRLSRLARRTALIRALLAVALVLLVLFAAESARHPGARKPSALPVHSGDMIVLDLSASISSDTFSRIAETLHKLVATNGRYGLVVFSDVAYEALPPGTPASALEPLIRYFTVSANPPPGGAQALPTSPWTESFSRGTNISAGLDLAHRILLARRLSHAHVVLISDLNDDPEDLQRLNQVLLSEYGRHHTPLRVVALNAEPGNEAFFSRVAGTAVADASPLPSTPSPETTPAGATLPRSLLVAILAVAVGLAVYVLQAARLRWDASRPGEAG
jgi:von Willebrand factor type A domain